jgi:hypothetical protein
MSRGHCLPEAKSMSRTGTRTVARCHWRQTRVHRDKTSVCPNRWNHMPITSNGTSPRRGMGVLPSGREKPGMAARFIAVYKTKPQNNAGDVPAGLCPARWCHLALVAERRRQSVGRPAFLP